MTKTKSIKRFLSAHKLELILLTLIAIVFAMIAGLTFNSDSTTKESNDIKVSYVGKKSLNIVTDKKTGIEFLHDGNSGKIISLGTKNTKMSPEQRLSIKEATEGFSIITDKASGKRFIYDSYHSKGNFEEITE